MYRQFCKNFHNYIKLLDAGGETPTARLKIAEKLRPLVDITAYEKYKNINIKKYRETGNLIYMLFSYRNKYPVFDRFLWDLWAYGFDMIEFPDTVANKDPDADEMVKLVDLMLSTHYF